MQYTLALDLKTGTLSLVSSREALTSLTLRRGGRYGLRLFVTEHGSPVDLPAGHTVESSAKKSADSPNALIFTPWAGASPVECTLHAAGSVLDGLLAADGDATNDVESVDLLFDVLVLDGSGEVVAQSQRVTLTVENTVTRGGETGPEHAPLSARLIESLLGVTGLVGGEPEHLDARATVGLPLGWRVLVKDGDWLRVFELQADDGGGIPENAVLPVDHDEEDNAKVWLPASFEGVTAEQLADALTGKADASTLSDHTGSTGNPHNVTAAQVGLGNVPNYGVASQAQAEAGTATDKLMTPERTAQAIAALGGGGGEGKVKVKEYTTPGTYTYTPQSTCKFIRFRLVGGGGGGGAGPKWDNTQSTGGGGGGGPAAVIESVFGRKPVGDLTIIVGAGGDGGAASSGDNSYGDNGDNGTASVLSDAIVTISAPGGNGGGGGQPAIAGGGGAALSVTSYIYPNTALASSGGGGMGGMANNGSAGTGSTPTTQILPGGGGGGGGSQGTVEQNGGRGAPASAIAPGIVLGPLGGAPYANGGNGIDGFISSYGYGTGGSGGASHLSGGSAKGGDGIRGSGGGGGGATKSGQAPGGAGGKGGDGYCLIVEFFE